MAVTFTGWASTRDLDQAAHVVSPTAFDASIKSKGLGGPKGIKLLWQHNHHRVIGRITKLTPRERGLWMEGLIDDPEAERAISVNGPLNFSIGFFPIDVDLEEAPSGKEYLLFTKGELTEVSVVTFPCQAEAIMVSVQPHPNPGAAA